MPRLALLVLVLAFAGPPACGGSDAGDVERFRITAGSQPALDGTVRSDAQVESGPHVQTGDRNVAAVGDDAAARETRMFLSFDTSDIPAAATILTARLSFRQFFAINAVVQLNPLLIELLDYGDSLDAGDFALVAARTPVSFTLDNLNVVRTIDLTAVVQSHVRAGHARTQFRLRMQGGTNGNTLPDRVAIETADNDWGTGDRPELFVEYTAAR